MRIAYFDCISGISGDMSLAALLDAGASLQEVDIGIKSLGLPIELSQKHVRKRGFRGISIQIVHAPEHAHRSLRDIIKLIRQSRIELAAKDLAIRIFERLARAEAQVHGTTLDRIHFHEVGAIDSIVDIVGFSIAWTSLSIEKAYASPIPTGTGRKRIAHGNLTIPAPATAEILQGVPLVACDLEHELTTPTGAAIIRELSSGFGPLPGMQVSRIGYGAGTLDLKDRPNLLRVLIGESAKPSAPSRDHNEVIVIETNLDDISGEQIGFAVEQIWGAGALDVFTSPISMKKNRPGVLLCVIARPDDRRTIERLIFKHTGSLGVRYRRQARTILPRAQIDVSTPWGIVSGKVSELPDGSVDFSPEYEECREIALESGLRLVDVINEVRGCYEGDRPSLPDSQNSVDLESINEELNTVEDEHELDIETKPESEDQELDEESTQTEAEYFNPKVIGSNHPPFFNDSEASEPTIAMDAADDSTETVTLAFPQRSVTRTPSLEDPTEDQPTIHRHFDPSGDHFCNEDEMKFWDEEVRELDRLRDSHEGE